MKVSRSAFNIVADTNKQTNYFFSLIISDFLSALSVPTAALLLSKIH
jgi:hypothetical protein